MGAVALHVTASYEAFVGFLRDVSIGQERRRQPGHAGTHRCDDAELSDLLARLSDAASALTVLAALEDHQLDAVPDTTDMRFCDGQRTLEQVVRALLKHQQHQIDAVRADVA